MVAAVRAWPLVISACVAITVARPGLLDLPLSSIAEPVTDMLGEPGAVLKNALSLIGASPLHALTGDVIRKTKEANGNDVNSHGDHKMLGEPGAVLKDSLALIGDSPLEALTGSLSSRPIGDVIRKTKEASGTDDNNSLGDRKVSLDPERGNNIRDDSHNETHEIKQSRDKAKGKGGEAPKDGGVRVLLLRVIKIIQKIITAPLRFIQQFSQL